MTDKTQTKVYLPDELKALLDADKRSNSEVVEAALWREFGGERKGALQRRVEEKQRRISILESERNERDREIEDARGELEALRRKLEAVEQEADRYERHLEEIENMMHDDGMSVFPEHGSVQDAADTGDVDAEQVIADLRERNPDLSDQRFERGGAL